jgi:HD-GYP domain-containing protein (c-di-GMP phosphodiesterase class II)
MRFRIQWYVYSVAAAALGLTAFVIFRGHVDSAPMLINLAILSVLAVAGEMLGFVLPQRAAMGSIGFIPFFAAAILLPSWQTIIAVIVVRVGLELSARREFIKGLLNVASHTLMAGIAVLVYTVMGGVSLFQEVGPYSLTEITQRNGLAALVAFTAAFFANNGIVFTAIAVSTGRRVLWVLLENTRSTVMIDLITTPLVFVFAWVFAKFGWIAGGALWVPILGLRQVHLINLELEGTNEELLELMVKSIEARDPYTSGHSRRVQHYSVIIARAIGLSEKQTSEVGRAGLLHDVGKIYEKYAPVISKQDKLTAEEWAIIKDHPVDGANLVATMTRLRAMVPAVRGHHENWDGTGYPDGLAGEVIPLASRIIRFADTIDAMTTERPYRKPLTEVQVRAEVVRCRGTQFDPEIADRLLSSALWFTLFAPCTNERTTPALSIVGSPGGRRRSSTQKLAAKEA